MKTHLTKITAVWAIAALLTVAVTGASKAAVQIRELPEISNIKVSGNVDLYITQGESESVKVYDNHYNTDAVSTDNGTLTITSFEKERLTVLVQVTDLSSIEASGNSQISSLTRINSDDLSVTLGGSAVAFINTHAVTIKTSTADQAYLNLSGDAENQSLAVSDQGRVDATRFDLNRKSVNLANDGELTLDRHGKSIIIKANMGYRNHDAHDQHDTI